MRPRVPAPVLLNGVEDLLSVQVHANHGLFFNISFQAEKIPFLPV